MFSLVRSTVSQLFWPLSMALCQPVVQRAGNTSDPLPFAHPSHAIGQWMCHGHQSHDGTHHHSSSIGSLHEYILRNCCARISHSETDSFSMPCILSYSARQQLSDSRCTANTQPQRAHTSCDRFDGTDANNIALELRARVNLGDCGNVRIFSTRIRTPKQRPQRPAMEFPECAHYCRDSAPTVDAWISTTELHRGDYLRARHQRTVLWNGDTVAKALFMDSRAMNL